MLYGRIKCLLCTLATVPFVSRHHANIASGNGMSPDVRDVGGAIVRPSMAAALHVRGYPVHSGTTITG